VVERCTILGVYLSYPKSFSEKKQDATPAQRLGIMSAKLHTREILATRLVAGRRFRFRRPGSAITAATS
jgi:hypothetical protein